MRKCFNITGKYGIMKQKVTVFVNGWHMHTESEIEKLAAEYMEEGRTAFFSKELGGNFNAECNRYLSDGKKL